MPCVVSHDAGGAEIISSLIRQQGLQCQYVLAGPAIKIFQRKLGSIDLQLLDNVIHKADWLLCGTSWQSDLEWQAIALAREEGKRSVAFLDHWVNYQERFVRGGETHLPDEIWVGDPLAENLARNHFPTLEIRLFENPYFHDLRKEFAKLTQPHKLKRESINVLYVCEALREHAMREFGNERYWGYTEEEALRYFLSNSDILGHRISQIVIRPHPSEEPDKYDWARHQYDLPIINDAATPLFHQVAACDVVIGCESMAMVAGLLAGRRVISCIPPGGKPCALPQPEIELMQELIKLKKTNVVS